MNEKVWKVYLSGEIHSDWREQIADGVAKAGLPVVLNAPVTVHEDSDDCGVAILGGEDAVFWHDHKGALLNSVRTGTLIADADVVVVRFGEKYKQWNAAFDAGYAAALGKPLIIMHQEEHNHALKEVDAAAKVVTRNPQQVVQALAYAIRGAMPEQWYSKQAAE
jgi:YtoQ family protein